MKKNIAFLEEKKNEIIATLKKPVLKGLGYEEVLNLTEKLSSINNAISYLTKNYLQ